MITDCIMSFNRCTKLTAPMMLKRVWRCAGVADVAGVAGVAAGVAALTSGRAGTALTMLDAEDDTFNARRGDHSGAWSQPSNYRRVTGLTSVRRLTCAALACRERSELPSGTCLAD